MKNPFRGINMQAPRQRTKTTILLRFRSRSKTKLYLHNFIESLPLTLFERKSDTLFEGLSRMMK